MPGPEHVQFVVFSTGNDTININAKGVNIASGTLFVDVFCEGNDRVAMDYSGVKKGSLAVVFEDPNPEPISNNQLSLDATFADGSRRGRDLFNLMGGPGDDNLAMFLHDTAGIHPLAWIDGGGGFNTAEHFDNVKAFNCQQDIVTHIGGHVVKVGPLGGHVVGRPQVG
jgi:hypothetical protein